MNTVWRIILDRYGDESRAKGGTYSCIETADLIIERYRKQRTLPILEVVTIGTGIAISDYLKDKKIPHRVVSCGLKRIGSADIHTYPEEI